MRQFELSLKFTDSSEDTFKVVVNAKDEQDAFKELFNMTENGWLFNSEFEETKFINVNAAFEIVVVDIENDRIETEKRSQEAQEAMKKFKR